MESRRTRSPWQERFAHPSPDDLLAAPARTPASLILHARRALQDRYGFAESVEWCGVWNWTLVFRSPRELPPAPAAAYLIPDPKSPRLCIPLREEALAILPLKRLARSVREALAAATVVGGHRWPCVTLTSKSDIDALLVLLGDPPAKLPRASTRPSIRSAPPA